LFELRMSKNELPQFYNRLESFSPEWDNLIRSFRLSKKYSFRTGKKWVLKFNKHGALSVHFSEGFWTPPPTSLPTPDNVQSDLGSPLD
jgi:hypothetical protein